MANRISCGINEIMSEQAGLTVGQIRAALSNALNIGADAQPSVNGQRVAETYVLQPGEHLDFQKMVGVKGYSSVATRMTQTVKFVSWEEDGGWLGYLEDYPDYWTQGDTLDDLKEHLKDLYADLSSGEIPGIRKVDDLVIS
jgi:hypothetical protein